jgi:hypothetical protein
MSLRRGVELGSMLVALACSGPAGTPNADPALAQYVLSQLPDNVQHRTRLDFEGKLALIGYDLEPVGQVNPGSPITVRLYWQRLGPIDPGWALFTHVDDAFGNRRVHADGIGVLRAKLPPQRWQLGKIYVDEQSFAIPADIASEATLLVGVWHAGSGSAHGKRSDLRLQVIGGPQDGHNRGIVAHIETGRQPPPRLLKKRKS